MIKKIGVLVLLVAGMLAAAVSAQAGVGQMAFDFQSVGSTVGTGLDHESFWDVAFDGKQYIATADTGVYVSKTGKAWKRVHGSTAPLRRVAIGNGLRLVVGDNGQLLYSRNGISWSVANSPSTTSLYCAAWGNGRFVIVDYWGNAYTSTNAKVWTAAKPISANIYALSQGNHLRYLNRQFLMVAGGFVYSSLDGITWTAHNTGVPTLHDVAFDGTQYLVVSGSGAMASSTTIAGPWFTKAVAGVTQSLYAATWTGSHFVVVGGGFYIGYNQGVAISSTNGSVWTKATLPTTMNLYAVQARGAKILAMGDYIAIQSIDAGLTYKTVADTATANTIYGVASHGATKVAGTQRGLLVSRDGGVSWFVPTLPAAVSTLAFGSVAYGVGRFVAASNYSVVESLDNGLTWSIVTPMGWGNTWGGYNVIWTGKTFSATNGTQFWSSANGSVWTQVNAAMPFALGRLYWDGKRYIGISGSQYAQSPNGVSWTSLLSVPALPANYDPLVKSHSMPSYFTSA